MRTPILLALMLSTVGCGAKAQSSFFNGGATANSSIFPAPPPTAYVYNNLQTEASTCPSYITPGSQVQGMDCWTANSVDATGAAGAGFAAPTLLNFNIATPSQSGASMSAAVANIPPVTVSATGTSGATSIVVTSAAGIISGSTVTGTGIGTGAAIDLSWNGTSTTIPLTVANSATVGSSVTFSTAFVSNALFYRYLPTSVAPVTPPDVTTGTLTVHAGTVTADNTSITLTGMSASDTTYVIMAIQVIIDGASGPPAYTNGTGAGPYTPATATIALSPGSHTFVVKAWNSNGVSSQTVNGTASIGGVNLATLSNLVEDMYYQIQGGETLQAFEFDPDVFYGTYQSLGSMQCRQIGTSAGNWFFWNSFAGGTVGGSPAPYGSWVEKPGVHFPCTAAQPTGTWHHYQIHVTYNQVAHTYAYQTFVIDGVTVYHNLGLTYNAQPGHSSSFAELNIQHQIDNSTSTLHNSNAALGNLINYDLYNLTAW